MNVKNQHQYNIGAVARLTQIHPETIRVWERRHNIVTPQRSDTGRRFYSEEDVERLLLIKQLTDSGNTISSLVNLSIQQLHERLSSLQSKWRSPVDRNECVCRILFLDESLKIRLSRELHAYSNLEVVNQFHKDDKKDGAPRANIGIIGVATINHDSLTSIVSDIEKNGCDAAVVVYNFGIPSAIKNIERSGLVCLKAPVSAIEIQDACGSLVRGNNTPTTSSVNAAVTPHRFSAEQLAKVATMSGSLACECPNHLAELIINLSAFEQYSGECENVNPKDAHIHNQLKQSTGKARNLLEESLARLIEIEGIKF